MNKKSSIDFWRVFQIVSIFSLLLIYLFQWSRMVSTPSQRTGADFMAFYAAGQIANHEGASQVYQLPLQQKYQEEVVGYDSDLNEIIPFIHPPFVIPLSWMTVTTDYKYPYLIGFCSLPKKLSLRLEYFYFSPYFKILFLARIMRSLLWE
jgi:hypothetical protein